VRPSAAAEWPYAGGPPASYAEALARAKVAAVAGDVVVGADTVVVVDAEVLGKPAGPEEAAAMLRRLSGQAHEVITGVAVRAGRAVRSGHARTRVTFRALDEEDIRDYVASGEPHDKAGAYAYQGGAAGFVTQLEGDADTVIGLPIRVLKDLLAGGLSPATGVPLTHPTKPTGFAGAPRKPASRGGESGEYPAKPGEGV
jgi:septum formation protein